MLFEKFKEITRELIFLNFDIEKLIIFINDTKGGESNDRGTES